MFDARNIKVQIIINGPELGSGCQATNAVASYSDESSLADLSVFDFRRATPNRRKSIELERWMGHF